MNYIFLRDEYFGVVGVISFYLFIFIWIIFVCLVYYFLVDLVVYCIYIDWFVFDVDMFVLLFGKVNFMCFDGIFLFIVEMEVV